MEVLGGLLRAITVKFSAGIALEIQVGKIPAGFPSGISHVVIPEIFLMVLPGIYPIISLGLSLEILAWIPPIIFDEIHPKDFGVL